VPSSRVVEMRRRPGSAGWRLVIEEERDHRRQPGKTALPQVFAALWIAWISWDNPVDNCATRRSATGADAQAEF
jgi:hypothetical protein